MNYIIFHDPQYENKGKLLALLIFEMWKIHRHSTKADIMARYTGKIE